MYCYENFSAELPTEVFILAYNRKKAVQKPKNNQRFCTAE